MDRYIILKKLNVFTTRYPGNKKFIQNLGENGHQGAGAVVENIASKMIDMCNNNIMLSNNFKQYNKKSLSCGFILHILSRTNIIFIWVCSRAMIFQ